MEGPAPQGSHSLGEWCSGVSMGTPRDRVTCTREGVGELCWEPAYCILSAYCILHIECSTFHSIIFQDLE